MSARAAVEWTLSEGQGERMAYCIEASDLKGFSPVRCPECADPLFLGKRGLTEHRDVEGELTHWTTECLKRPGHGCGALFTIFND